MRTLLPFEDYIKSGTIQRIRKDVQRAKSLIKQAEKKMSFLKEIQKKVGITKENADEYVEQCYDIIMYLIRAKLYLEGYSSKGIGAHEAEISYLRILGINEKDVQFADQMRYFRNGILYYGTSLDEEYAELTITFMNKIRSMLMKIVAETGLNANEKRG